MPIALHTHMHALPPLIPAAVTAYNAPGTNTANYNVTYNAFINARNAGIAAHGSLHLWISGGHASAQIHGLLAAFGMNAQGSVLVPMASLAHTLTHLPAASIDWIEGFSLPLAAAPCVLVNPVTHQSLSTELCALFDTLVNPGAITVSGGFVAASKTLHCLFPDLAPMIDGRHSGISYFNINRATYNPPLGVATWNAWLGFPLGGPANPSPRGAGRRNWDGPRFMAALGVNQHIYELWQAANGHPGIHAFLAMDPALGTTGVPRIIDKLLW
jgi:hypothetical protein